MLRQQSVRFTRWALRLPLLSGMQIVVINLASDRQRWQSVRAEFEAAGLQATRFEATDGQRLRHDHRRQIYCERLNQLQYHRPLREGELGCYASHLAAWRQLLASGDSCMAIFEDDIEVSANLPQVLESIVTSPLRWDLVKLIGRRHEQVAARAALSPRHDAIEYSRVPSLTGAYVVSRLGAHKLLRERSSFGRPVDVDMRHWWECDLRILGVQPYPVTESTESRCTTIHGRRVPTTPAMRLRKLALQLRYSVANWRARRGWRPMQAVPGRRSVDALRDAVERRALP